MTCKPLKEDLFESVIHSSKRYTYEQIDHFLAGKTDDADNADKTILEYLLPLHTLTQKLRDIRLENAFHSAQQKCV